MVAVMTNASGGVVVALGFDGDDVAAVVVDGADALLLLAGFRTVDGRGRRTVVGLDAATGSPRRRRRRPGEQPYATVRVDADRNVYLEASSARRTPTRSTSTRRASCRPGSPSSPGCRMARWRRSTAPTSTRPPSPAGRASSPRANRRGRRPSPSTHWAPRPSPSAPRRARRAAGRLDRLDRGCSALPHTVPSTPSSCRSRPWRGGPPAVPPRGARRRRAAQRRRRADLRGPLTARRRRRAPVEREPHRRDRPHAHLHRVLERRRRAGDGWVVARRLGRRTPTCSYFANGTDPIRYGRCLNGTADPRVPVARLPGVWSVLTAPITDAGELAWARVDSSTPTASSAAEWVLALDDGRYVVVADDDGRRHVDARRAARRRAARRAPPVGALGYVEVEEGARPPGAHEPVEACALAVALAALPAPRPTSRGARSSTPSTCSAAAGDDARAGARDARVSRRSARMRRHGEPLLPRRLGAAARPPALRSPCRRPTRPFPPHAPQTRAYGDFAGAVSAAGCERGHRPRQSHGRPGHHRDTARARRRRDRVRGAGVWNSSLPDPMYSTFFALNDVIDGTGGYG